jgi:hypothetical protein
MTAIYTTGTYQYSAVINHMPPGVTQHLGVHSGSVNSSPNFGPFETPQEVPIDVLANGNLDSQAPSNTQ